LKAIALLVAIGMWTIAMVLFVALVVLWALNG
jgi:hypothetical protein